MDEKAYISGVICEYNPFHNGHRHLLEQMRSNGATHIVAVMSGSFVQRGEPASVNKKMRTSWALQNGADLVIELPLPWAMSGAECFARGGVGCLDALGLVDSISFGAENADAELINQTVAALSTAEFSAKLSEELAHGISFASARENALASIGLTDCAEFIREPNNILAVEYAKAIVELGSDIRLVPISRIGTGHHSSLPSDGKFASASSLRELMNDLSSDDAKNNLKSFVPKCIAEDLLTEIDRKNAPILLNSLEKAILARWRTISAQEAALLPDVSEGIENRIIAAARTATSLDELLSAVKTKRYSYVRIKRIVVSAFLQITAEDSMGTPPYLRVLGMNKKGKELLQMISKTAKVPLIVRPRDAENLPPHAKQLFELECRASDLSALASPIPMNSGIDFSLPVF